MRSKHASKRTDLDNEFDAKVEALEKTFKKDNRTIYKELVSATNALTKYNAAASCIAHTKDKDGRAAWLALHAKYESDNDQRHEELTVKLHDCYQAQGESMDDYINRLNDIKDQLEFINRPVTEAQMVNLLSTHVHRAYHYQLRSHKDTMAIIYTNNKCKLPPSAD